jgi:hypothetical protein
MGTGPSPQGIAELKLAAAALRPYEPPKRKRYWPKWLTAKRLALILVADLILGSVGWHYLDNWLGPKPSAVAAAMEQTAKNAAHNNWSAVYNSLCSNDRAQIDESDLASAGEGELTAIGELDHVTVTSVRTIHQSLGPINLPAAQVSGQLVPVFGRPSPYTMVLVHELSGWHVCLSAGGYSSTALQVNAPIGAGFTA